MAALGTVAELKAIFRERPILEVRAPQPVQAMRLLDAMPEVEKTSIFGTAVHAVLRSPGVTGADIAGRLAAAGAPPQACELVQPSLEDVFLDVAERASA